jgi:ABC-type uncharacterized transport system YnjBCD ATPase subunit
MGPNLAEPGPAAASILDVALHIDQTPQMSFRRLRKPGLAVVRIIHDSASLRSLQKYLQEVRCRNILSDLTCRSLDR